MQTRIKQMRALRGMTQEQLALQAGVRRETIVHLEKGKYNPSLKLAVKLSRLLKTPLEELFLFDDSDLEAGTGGPCL